MSQLSYSDDFIRSILTDTKTIAVVGASPKAVRPSYGVSQFLIRQGYEVYPINPGEPDETIEGRAFLPSLAEVPVAIDMVDVFRRSEAVGGVVDEILKLQPLPKVIWMQLGVRDDAAAARAEAAGIKVVMDRCPKIEWPRLLG
ncbi:CoA-binding protein [Afifella sp. YEN Y35]|uniref:CoA-binding protein n=1 Tax=Afifella sp. YEN Y35 TaxID=3388337 RepID=UPI0039E025C7